MVDAKELEKLKSLPPKERLERLKQLEKQAAEERKRQEAETRRIINESLEELKLDEMLQEIEVEMPKDEVDVNRLLEEAKDIEDQVKKEKLKLDIGKGGSDYGRRIQELLPQNTMQEIQTWYQQDNVPPSQEQFLEVYENARQAYETVQASMQKGPDSELYSTPSEELIENVVESMKTLRALGYSKGWFDQGHP